MSEVTVFKHYWALLDRGSRRWRANHPIPQGYSDSLNVAKFEPKPEVCNVGQPAEFNADTDLRKAIWPVALSEAKLGFPDGEPQPVEWHFLFWAIFGLEGGTQIVKDPQVQPRLEVADGARIVTAIAYYGTYGAGAGSNGLKVDAFDVDAAAAAHAAALTDEDPAALIDAAGWLNDDFVSVSPKVVTQTLVVNGASVTATVDLEQGANEVGMILTDWDGVMKSCDVTAFQEVAGTPFHEWFLPDLAGDIKVLWGADGKPLMDNGVTPQPISDPTAVAVVGQEPRRLTAKQHAQAFALAFYRREQAKLDVEVDYAKKFGFRVNLDGTVSLIVLMSIYDPSGRLLVPKGTIFTTTLPPKPRPNFLLARWRDRLAGEMIRGAARIATSPELRRALMALYTHQDAAPRPGGSRSTTR